MDGRLTIEDGTILDLLELIVGAKPWEQGRRKALGKGKAGSWSDAVPAQRRSQVATERRPPLRHRQRALRALPRRRPAVQLRLFHRPRQQPRAGAGRQEGAHRRQARPEAGAARARHRLRLGRDGALPAQGRGRRRARHHAIRGTAQDRPAARQGRGRVRSCEVRADRLSPARRAVRPDRFGRHVRACRRRALRRILRQVPRAADRRRRDAAAHDRQARRCGNARPVHRQVDLPRLSSAEPVADVRVEREGEDDRQRRRDAAAALCLHAAPLARARDRRRARRSSRCTTSASSGCGNSTSPAGS